MDVVRGASLDAVGSDQTFEKPRNELREALELLVSASPDEVGLAIAGLRRFPERDVLAALERNFPGPLWFDRHHMRQLPKADQVSAIGCALLAYGDASVGTLTRLLVDQGAEPRFYAAILCRGITDPRLLRSLGRVALGSDAYARRAAIVALRAQASLEAYSGVLGWMRQAAVSEQVRQVWRIRSLAGLAELGDATALDVMLQCLADRDRTIARAAHEALVKLTAHDLGTMRLQWRRWRRTHGNLPRVAWLIDGLSDRRDNIRNHALAELQRISGLDLQIPDDAPRATYLEARERFRRWWQSTAPR